MARAKQINLKIYRNVAQYFTMSAAILYGVLWVVAHLITGKPTSSNSLSSVLIGATMIGGVAMGLLYVVHLSINK